MGAVAVAGDDPFGFGFPYAEYDGTSHAQGLAITAGLFDRLAGTDEFATFASHQLDVILGENAWGASFIVGAGHSFPMCVHHQIANITGALDGTTPLLLGAAVNGTNGADQFSYLGLPDGARKCPTAPGDTFGRFDGRTRGTGTTRDRGRRSSRRSTSWRARRSRSRSGSPRRPGRPEAA